MSRNGQAGPKVCQTFKANFVSASLLTYLFGGLFGGGFVLIFILTILLLAADFYYLKNIAGRRLVGLRWWNEVDIATGDSNMVFESADGRGNNNGNKTDNRFFWLAVYVQPALWIGLAILALFRFQLIWLSIIGKCRNGKRAGRCSWAHLKGFNWVLAANCCAVVALVLTIANTLAFSRCDKFSQANALAGNALYGSGLMRNVAGGMMSRMFSFGR